MLVTFIVIAYLEPYICQFLKCEAIWVQDEKLLSVIALSCSIVTTLFLLIRFIVLCRKAKKKVKFKGLIKEAVAELKAIEVRHYCYIEEDKEQGKKDNQIRIEKLADMIENLDEPKYEQEPENKKEPE